MAQLSDTSRIEIGQMFLDLLRQLLVGNGAHTTVDLVLVHDPACHLMHLDLGELLVALEPEK